MAVEVVARGALNDERTTETACRYPPEAILRHKGGASPKDLHILRVRGNSMEPEMRECGRPTIDTARRRPGTGEMAMARGGTGLVVKRVKSRTDPPGFAGIDMSRRFTHLDLGGTFC